MVDIQQWIKRTQDLDQFEKIPKKRYDNQKPKKQKRPVGISRRNNRRHTIK